MKLHYGALLIIGISILGILLFSVTPVISGKDSIYLNSDNWSESRVLAFGFGNGKTISEGEILGNPFDGTDLIAIDEWSEAFPIYVPILVMIGFVFSIIAGVLFFFVDTSATIKTVAVIIGILGGVLVISGIMTFLQWGQWFLSSADTGFYNIGFFTTVIAGVAIVILSIGYLISKPKRKKQVVY